MHKVHVNVVDVTARYYYTLHVAHSAHGKYP
jgi:hypothetical protein